jgi:hypothetical protein
MKGYNGVLSGHPTRYLQEGDHGHCVMEDISVEDCDIDVEGSPISFWIEPGITLGGYGNVAFRNVRLKGRKPITLQGTGDTILKNVVFENVTGKIEAERPIEMKSVEGIRFVNFNVTSGRGKKSPAEVNNGESWEKDP